MRVRPAGLLCLLTLALTGSTASAYSVAPPRRQAVFSPNRAFVLDADPDAKVNTVYSTADRATPLWSFPGVLWVSDVNLSNDGAVVAVVSWPFIQERSLPGDGAVSFYNRDGLFRQ